MVVPHNLEVEMWGPTICFHCKARLPPHFDRDNHCCISHLFACCDLKSPAMVSLLLVPNPSPARDAYALGTSNPRPNHNVFSPAIQLNKWRREGLNLRRIAGYEALDSSTDDGCLAHRMCFSTSTDGDLI